MTQTERQSLVIDNWIKFKGRAVVEATVGVGKTRIGTNIIQLLKSKKETVTVTILVPTVVLQRQWIKTLKDLNIYENIEVRSFKSLSKELVNSDLLIIDELHAALSTNGLKQIFESKFDLFLGLTATINRLDENEKYLLSQFPICDTITKKEALENGWVAKNTIYKVELDIDLSEYLIINEQYTHHFSFFNFNFYIVNKILKEGTRSFFVKNLADEMRCSISDIFLHATNTMRLINQRKQWLYNHPIKVAITDDIISARKGSKIITFSESQQIANSLPYGKVVHSGMTSKKQREIIKEFSAMESGVLHSVKSLQAGLNVVDLNVGIATSFNSSKIARVQSAGRIERADGNKESEFFNLVINNTIECKWFEKAYSGIDYIRINQEELKDVLGRKQIRIRKNKTNDFEYLF